MGWFAKLCRRSGLMIHHVADAAKTPVKPRRREVRREVDERDAGPGVTLRRTTIDEVEFRPPRDDESPRG